jgi:hypothetical protein
MSDTHKYAIGTYLFSTQLCDEGIFEAKKYIKRMNLTRDDVKIVSSDGMVSVKTIREIDLGKAG